MGEADSYRKFDNQGDPQQRNGYGNGQQQYQQQYQPQYHHQQDGGGYYAGHHSGPPTDDGSYSPPPPYSFNPPKGHGEAYAFEDAFKIEKPKYNDLWAGILFLLVFAGYVAISVISIHGYVTGSSGSGIYHGTNKFSLNSNTIILFACCLAVAFTFSYAYIWLARLFPKQFIWITGILNVSWAVGTAVFYLWKKYWALGGVFLVFALLFCLAFWSWIARIPYSALMLKTSIDISKRHGHVYLVSLIGGFLATALAAWYSVTLVAIFVAYEPSKENPRCGADGSGCGIGRVIGLTVYITFAMYWISEWLKNTIHTIIAGVYGTWYFAAFNYPKGVTRGATKRALTYSFGSISLGSLVVAIIQFIKQICSSASSQASQDGCFAYVIFCILTCVINLIDWAVQFINRYAFCHIALYGKPYLAAAKDTWRMIKDRGIDALINDCLINPVLSFGAFFIGYACALLAYLYLLFTKPGYDSNGQYTPIIMGVAFLIGFQIAHVFTTPLGSGIDTIFVAAGWDPQIMIRDHPELYKEMVRLYPKVQEAIH